MLVDSSLIRVFESSQTSALSGCQAPQFQSWERRGWLGKAKLPALSDLGHHLLGILPERAGQQLYHLISDPCHSRTGSWRGWVCERSNTQQ